MKIKHYLRILLVSVGLALGTLGVAIAIHPGNFDLDNNGQIDQNDLQKVIDEWLQTGTKLADLNHDGVVNAKDAGILLSHWGAVPSGEKLNVVVIVTDDQRADTATPQFMPETNKLIADAGVRFPNAFASTPLCCPSRASVFTGLYSHNHGVVRNGFPNGGAIKFTDAGMDKSTVATWLKNAGYRTGLFGKYLNQYSELVLDRGNYTPPGWDDWHAFGGTDDDKNSYYDYDLIENGTKNHYQTAPGDYSTNVLLAKAKKFINDTPDDKPLFLYFAPFAPHGAIDIDPDGPAIPYIDDIDDFAGLPPHRPDSFNEADISDKPTWLKEEHPNPLTPTEIVKVDLIRQRQIESLQAVDRAVKEIVDKLAAENRLDKTVIVFTSDNGYMLGEHRVTKKDCMYEECIKIPMYVRAPGVGKREETKMVMNIDLAPSIAEWAQAEPATRTDGISFAKLLKDATSPWRTTVLLESLGHNAGDKEAEFSAVRDNRYIYGEYANGDKEFYDLQTDPFQLISNSGHAEVGRLKKILDVMKISRLNPARFYFRLEDEAGDTPNPNDEKRRVGWNFYNETEKSKIAKFVDLIFDQREHGQDAPLISLRKKTAEMGNPNLKFIQYWNLWSTHNEQEVGGYTEEMKLHEDWPGTSGLYTRASLDTACGQILADISDRNTPPNASLRLKMKTMVEKFLRTDSQTADGMFFDISAWNVHWSGVGVKEGDVCRDAGGGFQANFVHPTSPPHPDSRDYLTDYHRYLQEAVIQEKLHLCNALPKNQAEYDASKDDGSGGFYLDKYLAIVDGCQMDGAFVNQNGNPITGKNLDFQLWLMRQFTDKKKYFLAKTIWKYWPPGQDVTDPERAYAFANYLLGTDGKYALFWPAFSMPDYDHSILQAPIGNFTGNYENIGTPDQYTFRRLFEAGVVAVNADGCPGSCDHSVPLPSGNKYKDVLESGCFENSISIPKESARILYKVPSC